MTSCLDDKSIGSKERLSFQYICRNNNLGKTCVSMRFKPICINVYLN